MNGDVVHLGGSDFTLIDKLLSNEYITTHQYASLGTVNSRSYSVSGAYNKNNIKIRNVYTSTGATGHYAHVFNGTYTFTLPISITGNYTIETICDDPVLNTVTQYFSNPYSYSTTMDINGNNISIPISNYTWYTGQSSGNAYLRIIGLTKN